MDIENSSFYGKRIGDMERGELFRVIKHLSGELLTYRTPEMARTLALGRVAMMKQGTCGPVFKDM